MKAMLAFDGNTADIDQLTIIVEIQLCDVFKCQFWILIKIEWLNGNF